MSEEKHWRCLECGYLHIGEEPPELCPECLVPRGAFVLVEEKEELKAGKE